MLLLLLVAGNMAPQKYIHQKIFLLIDIYFDNHTLSWWIPKCTVTLLIVIIFQRWQTIP